jgi:hypothetical protein
MKDWADSGPRDHRRLNFKEVQDTAHGTVTLSDGSRFRNPAPLREEVIEADFKRRQLKYEIKECEAKAFVYRQKREYSNALKSLEGVNHRLGRLYSPRLKDPAKHETEILQFYGTTGATSLHMLPLMHPQNLRTLAKVVRVFLFFLPSCFSPRVSPLPDS